MKNLLIAACFSFALVGFALADTELNVVITGFKDGKVTYKEKKGKMAGDEKTSTVAEGAVYKVGKAMFDKDTKKATVEETGDLEGGKDSAVLKGATADAPVAARIYIAEKDDGKIKKDQVSKIVVTQKKKAAGE